MGRAERDWATEEFGAAELGDARRNRRLVAMVARAATAPAGTITRVFADHAEREAAYRLLESETTDPAVLRRAAAVATAKRCQGHESVIVPIDGSSLHLNDPGRHRGLGPVGSRAMGAQGLLCKTSLALDTDGTPLGLLDQHYWMRSHTPPAQVTRRRGCNHDRRPRSERESYLWVEVMRRVVNVLGAHARGTTPWFQLDRGGDCLSVLQEAVDAKLHLTVRATHDRCLRWPNGRAGHLLAHLKRLPVLGRFDLQVPERPKQIKRTARMVIRSAPLPLDLPLTRRHRRTVTVRALLVTEINAPRGQTPLRWLLFTTHQVQDDTDAVDVVNAYALRWRIEDFHKTLKSGACNVEASQLQTPRAIMCWATIMSSVAARIERIKHASRETPDVPASDYFSRDEIDAALLLYQGDATKPRTPYKLGQTPTIAELTKWVASLGGHMGNPIKRPPGSAVIRRGLERVIIAAKALALHRATKM